MEKSYCAGMFTIMANDKKAVLNQRLTVTAASLGLTVPDNANYALVQVESSLDAANVVRMWFDGTAPTATTGLSRGNWDVFDINERENLLNFRVILATGAPATTYLIIQYFE